VTELAEVVTACMGTAAFWIR